MHNKPSINQQTHKNLILEIDRLLQTIDYINAQNPHIRNQQEHNIRNAQQPNIRNNQQPNIRAQQETKY